MPAGSLSGWFPPTPVATVSAEATCSTDHWARGNVLISVVYTHVRRVLAFLGEASSSGFLAPLGVEVLGAPEGAYLSEYTVRVPRYY